MKKIIFAGSYILIKKEGFYYYSLEIAAMNFDPSPIGFVYINRRFLSEQYYST
jgi:hypothetical protein